MQKGKEKMRGEIMLDIQVLIGLSPNPVLQIQSYLIMHGTTPVWDQCTPSYTLGLPDLQFRTEEQNHAISCFVFIKYLSQ